MISFISYSKSIELFNNDNRHLLAKFNYFLNNNNKIKENYILTDIIIYLHGFPDMSIHPVTNDFYTSFPRKIVHYLSKNQDNNINNNKNILFICFNFSGTPGSDKIIHFYNKLISHEIKDVLYILKYIYSDFNKEKINIKNKYFTDIHLSKVHLIGLSTGAIIAALLRNPINSKPYKISSITCISGLINIKKGTKYDFNEKQMNEFNTLGYCLKEFYIPYSYYILISKDIHDKQEINQKEINQQDINMDKEIKVMFKLSSNYIKECYNDTLNIYNSVQLNHKDDKDESIPRLLVIHGTKDIHVPIENGKELFVYASEPKAFVSIKNGNHFLSNNTKHFKKLMNRFWKYQVMEEVIEIN